METEKSIVKAAETRLPKFVEDAYESVDKMERFAEILLNSKLVPNHFYEKLPDGKPDFTKGKTPAVVAVLIQGYQLQLPPLTALQHIIPVNGLLSIKGDLAKSMIFNSGKLKPGSWVEEETGSIEDGNLVVKITATRSDNGQTLSRSFSVAQAKRAGLWITEQQVNGQDGWKYKSSAWWKYPSRMINYRALGFLARDMFPDVMAGIYTTEEAMDLPKDTTEVIETADGTKITIPDKEHTKERSKKLTERVADKIQPEKFAPVVKEQIQEAEEVHPEAQQATVGRGGLATSDKDESPFKAEKGSVEYMNGVKVIRDPQTNEITNMDEINGIQQDETPVEAGQWTMKQMEDMDTADLLEKVNSDTDMMEASELIGGKNTNKKLRGIIFAWQNGNLAEHVVPFLKDEKKEETPPPEKRSEQVEKEIDEFLNPSLQEKAPTPEPGNKYGIEVPPYDKDDCRDFASVKMLFNKLMGITPQITTPRYMYHATKLGFLKKYPDKEAFLKYATKEEIDTLLNEN